MKVLLFVLLLPNISFGQPKSFQFSDSAVEVGQELNLDIRFNTCRLIFDSLTLKPMDSLLNFIKVHSGYTFEFAFNTDCRGDSTFNMRLCEQRAMAFKGWLLSEGIPEKQVATTSNGEKIPTTLYFDNTFIYELLPEKFRTNESYPLSGSFIDQFKSDRKLYESLHSQNRRTVMKIVSIDQ